MKSSFNWNVSSTQLKPFTCYICDIAHPYKSFRRQYLRYHNSLFFIIITHVFVSSSHILMNSMPYSISDTFSYHYNIPISAKKVQFCFNLFKVACHANPGAERKWAGSSSYIQIHHQLRIMCYFEHMNHDNPLNFLV